MSGQSSGLAARSVSSRKTRIAQGGTTAARIAPVSLRAAARRPSWLLWTQMRHIPSPNRCLEEAGLHNPSQIKMLWVAVPQFRQ
jgi:hypothetical protein